MNGFSLLSPQGGRQAVEGILIKTSQSQLSLTLLLGDLVQEKWCQGREEEHLAGSQDC